MVNLTIITGAGRGIGLATAERLLDSDPEARCALVDLDLSGAAGLIERFGAERAIAIEADVTDRGAAFDATRDLARGEGAVTGLVTAAGIARVAESADLDRRRWHDVLDVHLDGTLFWCQAAAAQMGDDGGAIVCVSSVVARIGHPRRLAYAVAKAGVEELVRTLAVEWGPGSVRVNAVAPGYVATEMVRNLHEEGMIDLEAIAAGHIPGRLAEPDEIAAPIAFLLSPSASFITGTVITVDGGFSVLRRMSPDGSREPR